MQRDLIRLLDELVANPALPIPPPAFLQKEWSLADFWNYYNLTDSLQGKSKPNQPQEDADREEFDL
jgi:hypothetical protein